MAKEDINHLTRSHQRAMTTFAALWAVAILLHLLANPGELTNLHRLPPLGLLEATLGITAVAVLARPQHLPRFLLLITLQLANVLWRLPIVPNHWLLTAFINAAILLSAAPVLLRRQTLDPGALYLAFAPIARLELIIFYLFAAFGKMNGDFLRPAVSCAVEFYRGINFWLGAQRLPFLASPAVEQFTIYAALFFESAIPILLFIRRTRYWGIIAGALFHFVLALDPVAHVFDFSSVLYTLYVLFLPLTFFDWLAGRAAALHRRLGPAAPVLHQVGLATLLIILAGTALYRTTAWAVILILGRQLLWFAFALILIIAVFRFINGRRLWRHPLQNAFARPNPAAALLVTLLILNGLSPYLGLKTGIAFTMFSNLRTEGGVSNHLLVTRPLRLNDYQDDLVLLLDASADPWPQFAAAQLHVTRFELRDYVYRHPEASLAFVDGATEYRFDRAGDAAEQLPPLPWWQRKVLLFRPVGQQGAVSCQW